MNKKLHWVKEAFSREIRILDGEVEIGKMWQDCIFTFDVQARLRGQSFLFDVKGFLKRSVNIHDLNDNRKIVGVANFSFGRKAELVLPSGEKYLWRRENFFMRTWNVLQVGQGETHEVFHYEQLRSFFTQTGEITGEFSDDHAEILILTGLFIANYFRRRRRRGAAAS